MNENELTVQTTEILPANLDAEIHKAVQMRAALDKLFKNLLQQGIDFDRVPGTDKPTLLKPGGELLCQVFKLAPGKPDMIFANEDFEKGIFSYTVGVPVIKRETGEVVAYGIGAANSQEIKYKYRYVKQEGADEKEKILNPEPADGQNTLVKMAAKRAYIDGVLKATGASRMFTQDAEDMPWLKAEKASSRQLDFVKSLFKGKSDDEALAEISGILGREVTSWDEITRPEASQIIEAKKNSNSKRPSSAKDTDTKYSCSECSASITKAEAEYSGKNYGKRLCRKCQAEAQKSKSQEQQEQSDEGKPPWEQEGYQESIKGDAYEGQ